MVGAALLYKEAGTPQAAGNRSLHPAEPAGKELEGVVSGREIQGRRERVPLLFRTGIP